MSNLNSITNDRGFIGTGNPYFIPEGDDSAAFYLGNPLSVKIALSSETKTRISHRKHDSGAVLDSITIPKPAEVTFETDTFQPLTWGMAMMGKAATQTSTVQTIADEPAKARLDGYHALKNHDIDPASIEVKKGGTAIPAGKYELNAEIGMLKITDETAAAEGDDLTVSYKTLTTTRTVIDGARVTSFKGKIILDGRDEVTKKRAKLIIPSVTLAVDGDFDWFSDDFNKVTMKGTAAVGKNGEAPYTVELYN